MNKIIQEFKELNKNNPDEFIFFLNQSKFNSLLDDISSFYDKNNFNLSLKIIYYINNLKSSIPNKQNLIKELNEFYLFNLEKIWNISTINNVKDLNNEINELYDFNLKKLKDIININKYKMYFVLFNNIIESNQLILKYKNYDQLKNDHNEKLNLNKLLELSIIYKNKAKNDKYSLLKYKEENLNLAIDYDLLNNKITNNAYSLSNFDSLETYIKLYNLKETNRKGKMKLDKFKLDIYSSLFYQNFNKIMISDNINYKNYFINYFKLNENNFKYKNFRIIRVKENILFNFIKSHYQRSIFSRANEKNKIDINKILNDYKNSFPNLYNQDIKYIKDNNLIQKTLINVLKDDLTSKDIINRKESILELYSNIDIMFSKEYVIKLKKQLLNNTIDNLINNYENTFLSNQNFNNFLKKMINLNNNGVYSNNDMKYLINKLGTIKLEKEPLSIYISLKEKQELEKLEKLNNFTSVSKKTNNKI